MNTLKSNQIVKERNVRSNPLQRGNFVYERSFNTSAEELFTLLCPTTEYDWLPGWGCELLHSKTGYAEYNCIFKSNFFGHEEIWVCTRYEPTKAIEFARTSENFCAKMEISLAETCDNKVAVRWVVTVSAIKEAGNPAVEELKTAREGFENIIDALEFYVNKGEMIS